MNEDIAKVVLEACCSAFGEARSYSGRGMNGRSCVGVNCDNRDTTADLVKLVIHLMEGDDDGMRDAASHLSEPGAVASDSMGHGGVLYFPRLPYPEADGSPDSE
jgi:hypothetical protein